MINMYIYIYIYIYNLHNGECASVFNALLKTFIKEYIYIYIYIDIYCDGEKKERLYIHPYKPVS